MLPPKNLALTPMGAPEKLRMQRTGGGLQQRVITYLVMYIVAYSIHPLLIEALKYNGAASSSTFLFLIPHYLAMVICGSRSPEASFVFKNFKWKHWKKASLIGVLDILHQLFEKTGLMFIGSAMYTLVGNSSIVWTAIVSVLLLKKSLSPLQLLSLFVVCTGLGIKASDLTFKLDDYDSIGVLLTLIAALLHSLSVVANEKFLTGENAIPGPALALMIGILNLSLLIIWSCVWTIPRWDEIVIKNIKNHNGNILHITLFMTGLFCCSYIHAHTLWYILQQIGATSSGILKGVKAAAVFMLSHVFFCHYHEAQCLNFIKVLAATISVSGVILYAFVTLQDREFEAYSKSQKKEYEVV